MPYHSSDRLFTSVTNGQEAKHVNSLFKILFEYWLQMDTGTRPNFRAFTSHALRHGAIDDVSNDPQIPFATAAQRTGLMLQSFSNVFKYLSGGFKNDAKCARRYSDWYDVNCGGICPGIYYSPLTYLII